MQLLRAANATVAFLLELVMYGMYGYAGFHALRQSPLRWLAMIGVPAVAVVLWALFAAPQASHRLAQPWLFVIETVIQLLAGILFYLCGYRAPAIIFSILVFVSQLIALILKQ